MLAPEAHKPSHFHVPDGARFDFADEVCDLMVAIGYTVDEPERLATRALLPQRADGSWLGLESAVVCPRQNLKTATMIGSALHDTFVQGVERVVWTAHEFKTSSDAFRDFRAIIEGNDWLSNEVLAIRTANGKEGFELRNGSRLDILARTGRSGRGMGAPRLYLDEALYLDGRMMGALVPTVSARPNPHIIYGSSPGVPASVVLRSLRDRGRSGVDPHLGYIEWTSERSTCASHDCTHRVSEVGCQLDDEAKWWAANPALGRRITVEFVQQERRALESEPVEFMRERLGWWEDPPLGAESAVFPIDAWGDCLSESSSIPEGSPVVMAVDVSWDRRTAHIAAAGVRPDGRFHVQVVASGEGTDWVAPFIKDTPRRPVVVAVQGSGAPASSLIADLDRAGLPLELLGGADIARACGSFHDAITGGRLRHIGQPDLEQAVQTAVSRPLGDAWALDRKKSPTDIAGLVATVCAFWALEAQQGRQPQIIDPWEEADDA